MLFPASDSCRDRRSTLCFPPWPSFLLAISFHLISGGHSVSSPQTTRFKLPTFIPSQSFTFFFLLFFQLRHFGEITLGEKIIKGGKTLEKHQLASPLTSPKHVFTQHSPFQQAGLETPRSAEVSGRSKSRGGGESHGEFLLLSPKCRPQGSLCHQLQLARRCLGRFCAVLQPRPSVEGERCRREGCPRGHRAGGARRTGTGTGMGMGTASQSRAPAGESPKGCGTQGSRRSSRQHHNFPRLPRALFPAPGSRG